MGPTIIVESLKVSTMVSSSLDCKFDGQGQSLGICIAAKILTVNGIIAKARAGAFISQTSMSFKFETSSILKQFYFFLDKVIVISGMLKHRQQLHRFLVVMLIFFPFN